ncbi:MAG TPA: PfkB family carbohydrate kinase [Solirubrobacteraceae bacterium]
MYARGPSVAVVGHVEWVQFARVEHVPRAGEVVHAGDAFEEPAGGGAVAAVQLARLAGGCVLYTTLGDDEQGHRSVERLGELGVEVRASLDAAPTRRAVTLVDRAGERTITTLGARLEPFADGEGLGALADEDLDAVYFTAGDASALTAARRSARVLVASPRARTALGAGVKLDVLVLSGEDQIERLEARRAEGETELTVWTEGARGGSFQRRSGERGRWAATAPAGALQDAYGCGDSFAAALSFGLGCGMVLEEALALAARCGAACLIGRGPYERQLSAADL